MIDLHCHILHGIDDGPAAIGQSMALIRMAEENGINKIVLTPHLLHFESTEDFIHARDEKIEELRNLVSSSDINIELFPGAEVYIGDDIFYASDLKPLAINNSRYILSEFQYTNLSEKRFCRYIQELLSQGLTPIVAHPERYRYAQNNHTLLEVVVQMGALLQVNADALCGLTGRTEAKLARELVNNGLASFIATDAHSVEHRPNNLLEMLSRHLANIDEELLERLVSSNPEAVLNNEAIALI